MKAKKTRQTKYVERANHDDERSDEKYKDKRGQNDIILPF
jgi:hypothetical protein